MTVQPGQQIISPLPLASLIPVDTGQPQVASVKVGQGTFVANGTSTVTIVDANVTANSIIIPTLKTVGGTVGALPAVSTITPGTGFTIVATSGDTSTYNYLRIA